MERPNFRDFGRERFVRSGYHRLEMGCATYCSQERLRIALSSELIPRVSQ